MKKVLSGIIITAKSIVIILLTIIMLILIYALYLHVVMQEIPERMDTSSLKGERLYEDIVTYVNFGDHRTGNEGDRNTSAWIAKELNSLGYKTQFQNFTVRQYSFRDGFILYNNKKLKTYPHWWPEEASFSVTAPLMPEKKGKTSYEGNIVLTRFPRTLTGAYLKPFHRTIIHEIAARGARAAVVITEHASGEIFMYNVKADDEPSPIPVVLIGQNDEPILKNAIEKNIPITISIRGEYREKARTRNVIAELNRGRKKIVISTPLSGWFTCAAERGPGIALFLGLARWIARNNLKAHFIFIGTTGHEIGHGGMDLFMNQKAPRSEDTYCWLHLGASLAAYRLEKTKEGFRNMNELLRYRKLFFFNPSNLDIYLTYYLDLGFIPLPGIYKTIGEMEDVRRRGYHTYIGMAGSHQFFHTPADSPEITGPDILESAAGATMKALFQIITEKE